MENGWSIKHLHRLIMLSAVYQQRSDDRPDGKRIDPENSLLWKMNRSRLDFEATRDVLLAVAGTLDARIGGVPMKGFTNQTSTRRTVYAFIDRLNVPGLMRTFDFPSPDASSPQRATTTVAPQALFLMNNPFVLEQARRIVQKPELAGEKDLAQKIDRLYRLLYGRPPSPDEMRLGVAYVGQSAAALETYTQALLLTNEFVFVD
jgi:hypothetical protein